MSKYAILFNWDQNAGIHKFRANQKEFIGIMQKHGFSNRVLEEVWCEETRNGPVDAILAVQELNATFDWFEAAVIDVAMWRVEEITWLDIVFKNG